METNNENKNILSEPELRFREELKNCVNRIVDAADAKRANDIVAVHVGDRNNHYRLVRVHERHIADSCKGAE